MTFMCMFENASHTLTRTHPHRHAHARTHIHVLRTTFPEIKKKTNLDFSSFLEKYQLTPSF